MKRIIGRKFSGGPCLVRWGAGGQVGMTVTARDFKLQRSTFSLKQHITEY